MFPFRAFNSFVSLYYYAFSAQHSILMLSVQVETALSYTATWFAHTGYTLLLLLCVCSACLLCCRQSAVEQHCAGGAALCLSQEEAQEGV